MAKCRHWKQHWDPNADFVFLRRLRMGTDPKNPYVLPGDPVTLELRSLLGLNRLRRFWEAGAIGLADWAPDSGREARPDSAPEKTPPAKKKAKKKATKKKTPKKASKKKAKKKAPETPEPQELTNEQQHVFDALMGEGGWTEAEALEVARQPQEV